MPRLRKIRFVPFLLAALAAAAFVPMPAWGQGASLLDQQQDPDAELDRDADELERNGLRGILGPDRDIEAGRDGRGPIGADGLRGGALPDAATANRDITDRQPGDEPDRNAILRDRQLRGPGALDEAVLDPDREEDPYAALGIRVGSFLLFPELISETIFSDNLFLSTLNPVSDWAIALTPSLNIESDWSRHSLTGSLSGIRSFHEGFPSEDDETFSAGVTGQLDIRRTTNLVAAANYSEFFEDRSSSDFPDNAAERPRERTRDALLEGNHTFNRVTLTLRGEIAEEDFDDSILVDGTIQNNDDRDVSELRLTGRAAYEFRPGVSAFIETSTNERNFDQKFDDDGTLSGSSGYDVQGGLLFQLTGKLNGEASAGYAFQEPDDSALEDVDGVIFNAALEWQATGLTTLRLDASSEIDQTIEVDTGGSIIRAAAISVEHRPRRQIILGASLGYEIETFTGNDEKDEDWVFALTGEYLFTRSVALTVGYEHLNSTSSVPGNDYDVDEVRMGVRLRR